MMQKNNQIKNLILDHKITIFIKGTKHKPLCSFSSQAIEIMNKFAIDYYIVNVLEDKKIRHEVKKYSNWPTIPQLYIDGEFIGGTDIIRSLHVEGKLEEMLEKALNS
uniref:Glutaredoxin n=1 Tax=Rhodymenia pseudopalmata TaxID=31502 RepID=A0A1C9C7L7_RHOPU|nr:glutaredoxin [Rhodymenia pseudopalmata]AOM64372.1 glutaredoxin [Rhodymenia pseudopalmata]